MLSQKIPWHYSFPVIILSTLLAVVLIYAWQEPTAPPPGGNVPAPINVGPNLQYKPGALGVGGLSVDYGANLATLGGDVKVGTTLKLKKLSSAPSAESGFGKLYVKDDGYLYFKRETGTETNLTAVAAGYWNLSDSTLYPSDTNWNVGITAIPSGITGMYSLNWNALQICQFGTCCPPWKDCDGDGHTYMDGTDCDEGCNSCYVGSTAVTYTPDGKDQNCNGIVDESESRSKTCKFPEGSNGILTSAIQSACNSWCGETGTISGNGPYTGPYRDLWTGANFSNCNAWGAVYYEEISYFATAQPITCTCSSLQYR